MSAPTLACSEERFRKDVAGHVLTVKHEAGVYRHLRCATPGTGNMAFNVVTWPGWLCYSGDMGTYVFTRLPDMFEFFRRDDGGGINPGYWAEKVEAEDKDSRVREFDPEKCRERILEMLDEIEASDDLREAVEEEVLDQIDEGEEAVRRAARDFDFEGREGRIFECFWEVDLSRFTLRFIWALRAIVWAIKQWDARPAVDPETA